MYFAPGRFQPGTERGDWLIGHELAHVVQQGETGAGPDRERTPTAATPALESEASRAASAAVAGRAASVQLRADYGSAQAFDGGRSRDHQQQRGRHRREEAEPRGDRKTDPGGPAARRAEGRGDGPGAGAGRAARRAARGRTGPGTGRAAGGQPRGRRRAGRADLRSHARAGQRRAVRVVSGPQRRRPVQVGRRTRLVTSTSRVARPPRASRSTAMRSSPTPSRAAPWPDFRPA